MHIYTLYLVNACACFILSFTFILGLQSIFNNFNIQFFVLNYLHLDFVEAWADRQYSQRAKVCFKFLARPSVYQGYMLNCCICIMFFQKQLIKSKIMKSERQSINWSNWILVPLHLFHRSFIARRKSTLVPQGFW